MKPEARVVVEGLLQNEPGGCKTQGTWQLVLHLVPWRRIDDVAVADTCLRVEIPVSQPQLDAAMKAFRAGAAVQVEIARLTPPGDFPGWVGVGTNLPRAAEASASLLAAGEEFRRPVILHDPELGKLELQRSFDWFAGTKQMDGLKVAICITKSSAGEDRASDARDVERASTAVLRIQRDMKKIREAIATSMLALYNDTWRDDRRLLDAAEFLSCIRLSSMVIYPDGTGTLYHSDGGLFHDHTVEVRLKADGSVSEVCLAG